MEKARIQYIDFLKFIGLTLIILAHVSPPQILDMVRNFDVPLMVILSSALAGASVRRRMASAEKGQIAKYYFERIKRLAIPTWIFLSIYFLLRFAGTGEMYDLKFYINSFCFTNYGIGYVWIFLIYIYSSLMVPLFMKSKNMTSLIVISAFYVIYELLCIYQLGVNNRFVESTFCFIIPYAVLTFLGCKYSEFSKKQKRFITAFAAIVFVVSGIYYYCKTGSVQSVYIVKYPPRTYYLSYGVLCSFILLQLSERFNLKIYSNKFIVFVSKHSMWIYLWQILALGIYEMLHLPKVWLLKFVTVYAFSLVAVIVVNFVLDKTEKRIKLPFLKYLRG